MQKYDFVGEYSLLKRYKDTGQQSHGCKRYRFTFAIHLHLHYKVILNCLINNCFMNSFLRMLSFVLTALITILLPFNTHAQKATGDSTNSMILQKVEVEASFPGGPKAWSKYISHAITDNLDKLKRSDYGTCIVRFIVDTSGQVSDVIATTMKKSRLAKIAIAAITKGPKWVPAQQNGKSVNAYRLQPITLMDPNQSFSI
jgi:hypothetical protein